MLNLAVHKVIIGASDAEICLYTSIKRPYSALQTPATFLSRKTVYILITGIIRTLGRRFFQTFQGQSEHSQSNRDIKAFLMGLYKKMEQRQLFLRKPRCAICHNDPLNVNV